MKAEFSDDCNFLVIKAENSTETVALRAWSEEYFNDGNMGLLVETKVVSEDD